MKPAWPPWWLTNCRTSCSATALTASTPSSIACCLTRRIRSATSASRAPQAEEDAANAKANELLKSSPYKDQLATAKLFLNALESRQKDIPNLISPHLGDRVPDQHDHGLRSARSGSGARLRPTTRARPRQSPIVALPLGGRIKMDPWNDKLEMLKAKPVGTVAEREKMPFEVTPFMLYLTRQGNANSSAGMPNNPVTADSKSVAADKTAAPQQ